MDERIDTLTNEPGVRHVINLKTGQVTSGEWNFYAVAFPVNVT
jgi:hypothetical protein